MSLMTTTTRSETTREMTVEGHINMDAQIGADVTTEYCPDGVLLIHSGSGSEQFIETQQTPVPGSKVEAVLSHANLDPVFFSSCSAGGGLFRVGTRLHRGEANPLKLLNSGTATQLLNEQIQAQGFHCWSLNRQNTPTNLIIPHPEDRIIIKEPLQQPSQVLEDFEREAIAKIARAAKALVLASPKDGVLSRAVVDHLEEDSRFYFQLTNGLDLAHTKHHLHLANDVIANLSEWQTFGKTMGLPTTEMPETDPHAIEHAKSLLEQIANLGLAGNDAAICTLGKAGCLAVDWKRNRFYQIEIFVLKENGNLATPAGTGDLWTADYIHYREKRSLQKNQRDPVAVAALNATHFVVKELGLTRNMVDASLRILN